MNEQAPTTGSLVWHLAMRWRAEVDRALVPFDLTHALYSVLASLHAMTERGGPPTQRELADYTRLQPIYVSKLVRTLETAAHITRQSDSRDSRAVRLALTDPGRKTIVAARSVVAALDRRLTEPIGGSEGRRTKQLVTTLRELINHYDKFGVRT
jgi:DNA-binding MarR family transcriptional regulator